MSWNPAIAPACPEEGGLDAIDTLIIPVRATSVVSKSVAPCPLRNGKWWDRSFSSIRSDQQNL